MTVKPDSKFLKNFLIVKIFIQIGKFRKIRVKISNRIWNSTINFNISRFIKSFIKINDRCFDQTITLSRLKRAILWNHQWKIRGTIIFYFGTLSALKPASRNLLGLSSTLRRSIPLLCKRFSIVIRKIMFSILIL